MNDLDLLMRAATVALAFSAAFAIAIRRNRSTAAPYAAFAVAGIGAFMIASAPGAHASLGLMAFVFNAWCLATPGIVWLLARSLFRDGGRHNAAHLLAIGALVGVTMAGDYGRYVLGPLAAYPEESRMLLLAGRGAALALLFSACAMAVTHWREDLVEQRRRARAAFIVVVGSTFVALAASEFVFGGRGAPLDVLVFGHAALLALAFALLQVLARGGLAELLDAPAAIGPVPLTVVRSDGLDAAIARRVVEAMAERKLWKRDGLGIAELARELGTQEYRLRRAINRHLGYRNFNDFLHDYRLNEAAGRLCDAAERHLPVLTIALDCGYGSIGPFNRAFKARYGVTPSQFRNQSASTRDSASRSAKP
ncbi:MAG TPA: helix-turn-helix transcriptional regulator [Usitatibacter sp.]|nr:helix-turn-helix transcriptional regulator [Usitatibacter sp.]